jgi:hypothetical protein
MRRAHGIIVLAHLSIALTAAIASAQDAPAAPAPGPPPTAAPPPASSPPPDYRAPAVPPGYVLMPAQPPPAAPPSYPPGYSAPPEIKYKEGDPIPPGYHLEDKPRMGAVVTGIAIGGVAYGLGLLTAISDDFENQKGWLILPVVGPWLTLGQREDSCREYDSIRDTYNDCVSNAFTPLLLVIDGILQVVGGTLIFIGHAAPRAWLVRDGVSVTIAPTRVGKSAPGAVLSGTF